MLGAFSALGALTAIVAFAVVSRVDGEVRTLFRTVGTIAVALCVLTGYLASAAWRRWWPFRGEWPSTTDGPPCSAHDPVSIQDDVTP